MLHHYLSSLSLSTTKLSLGLPNISARADKKKYTLEGDIGMLSYSFRRHTTWNVEWLGYDETHNSWEPYANLYDSDQLHVFRRQNNLLRLIPEKFGKGAADSQQFSIL